MRDVSIPLQSPVTLFSVGSTWLQDAIVMPRFPECHIVFGVANCVTRKTYLEL
jgi:hypothetical protein